jgi:hypothetical protein
MKTSLFTSGIFALLCCAAPGFANSASVCDAVAGNFVQNCGFELGNFDGWTVLNNDGNTAVEGQNFWTTGVNSGNFYAALGDGATTPTTIEQTFTDVAGSTLTFSFYVATDGTPENFTADFDGTSVVSLVDVAAQGYTEYSFTLTATGSDKISFIEQDALGYIGLDDVVVVDPVATPEPSSLAFAVAALGLIALAHRRWTKKTA